MNGKVWFITGSSRGLGVAISKAALEAGHKVVATGRKAEDVKKALGENPSLLAVSMDVTKPDQIAHGVKLAMEKWGRIDVLVNNAGYGQYGAFEEIPPEDVRAQFDTNVMGLMNVTRAVLPFMRRKKSGHIFNVSSVAGYGGRAGASIYCASKFAVRGFSESLSDELKGLGIKVMCVAPGGFRTDFLEENSVRQTANFLHEYADFLHKQEILFAEMKGRQMGDPEKLAKTLVMFSGMEEVPANFLAGSDALERTQSKVAELQSEMTQWKTISENTRFQ